MKDRVSTPLPPASARPQTTPWHAAVVSVLLVAIAGCAMRGPAPPPLPELSGFLDDYSRLQVGGKDDLRWIYRDPDADWSGYDAAIIEPVTLWRSGKGALDPVPADDLKELVTAFEYAVRDRLGEAFRVVSTAGPGVMRIRLAITEARADDPILDVLTAHGDVSGSRVGADTALDPETRRFLDRAAIEGEIRDAQTDALLAQGIDQRSEDSPELRTWGDIRRGLARWADRSCQRLEARTGRR